MSVPAGATTFLPLTEPFRRSLHHVVELLVLVAVHARAGAARLVDVTHQHALAFKDTAVRGRVAGAGIGLLQFRHAEMVFAVAGSYRARGLGFLLCHGC